MSASTTSITAPMIPGAAAVGGPAGKAASALGGFEALMGAFFAATDGLLQAEVVGGAQPTAAMADNVATLQAPIPPGAAVLPLVGEAKPAQTPAKGKTVEPDATLTKADAGEATDAAAAVLATIAAPAAPEAAPEAGKVVKVTEPKDDETAPPAGGTADVVPAAVMALLAPASPAATPAAKVKTDAEPTGGPRSPQIPADTDARPAPPALQAPVEAAPKATDAPRPAMQPDSLPQTPAPAAAEPAKAAAAPVKSVAPAAAAAPAQAQIEPVTSASTSPVETAAPPPTPAAAAAAPSPATPEKPAKTTRAARETPTAQAAPAAAPRPGPTAQAPTAVEPQADKDAGRKGSSAAEPLTAEAATKAADPQGPALDPAAPAPASSTAHAAAPAPTVRGAPETVANLAAQIAKKLGARTTQFDVQLDPAGLGRVNVRVEINADGRVSAAMSFDNPQAAADLKSRANELQRALAQSGFDLSGGLSFDVAQDQGNPFAGQQNAFQSGENTGSAFRGRAFAQALETADAAENALAGARGYSRQTPTGVDVRI